jgi:hypothetical protein
MSNDTAERVEQVDDDMRIVYRLERASDKWWCIAKREERTGGLLGSDWSQTGWFKRGFEGVERPTPTKLRRAFRQLRRAAKQDEDVVEQTLQDTFEKMEVDVE